VAILVATLGGQDLRSRAGTEGSLVPHEARFSEATPSGQLKVACRSWAKAILDGLDQGTFTANELNQAVCLPMLDSVVGHIGRGRVSRIFAFGVLQDPDERSTHWQFDSYPTAEVAKRVYLARGWPKVIPQEIGFAPVDQERLHDLFRRFFSNLRFAGRTRDRVVYVSPHGGTTAMKAALAFEAQRWAGERMADGQRVELVQLQVAERADVTDPCERSEVREAPLGRVLFDELVRRKVGEWLVAAVDDRSYAALASLAAQWGGLADLQAIGNLGLLGQSLLESDFSRAHELAQKINASLPAQTRKLCTGDWTPKVLLQVHLATDRMQAGDLLEALGRVYAITQTIPAAMFESVVDGAATTERVRDYVGSSAFLGGRPGRINPWTACTIAGEGELDRRRRVLRGRIESKKGETAVLSACRGLLPCWAGGWQPRWDLSSPGRWALEAAPNGAQCTVCPLWERADADLRDLRDRAKLAMVFEGSPVMELRHRSAIGHGFYPTTAEELRAAVQDTVGCRSVHVQFRAAHDQLKTILEQDGGAFGWLPVLVARVLGDDPEAVQGCDLLGTVRELARNEVEARLG
jgi:hypothetical protein